MRLFILNYYFIFFYFKTPSQVSKKLKHATMAVHFWRMWKLKFEICITLFLPPIWRSGYRLSTSREHHLRHYLFLQRAKVAQTILSRRRTRQEPHMSHGAPMKFGERVGTCLGILLPFPRILSVLLYLVFDDLLQVTVFDVLEQTGRLYHGVQPLPIVTVISSSSRQLCSCELATDSVWEWCPWTTVPVFREQLISLWQRDR